MSIHTTKIFTRGERKGKLVHKLVDLYLEYIKKSRNIQKKLALLDKQDENENKS